MQARGSYGEASLNAKLTQGTTEWRAVHSGCGGCVHFGHWAGGSPMESTQPAA